MAATATSTIARPAGNGNSLLVALLKTAVDFLAHAENKRSAAVAQTVEAPASNDVDLWKLYWAATGSGANSPKVRRMLERAGQ